MTTMDEKLFKTPEEHQKRNIELLSEFIYKAQSGVGVNDVQFIKFAIELFMKAEDKVICRRDEYEHGVNQMILQAEQKYYNEKLDATEKWLEELEILKSLAER